MLLDPPFSVHLPIYSALFAVRSLLVILRELEYVGLKSAHLEAVPLCLVTERAGIAAVIQLVTRQEVTPHLPVGLLLQVVFCAFYFC